MVPPPPADNDALAAWAGGLLTLEKAVHSTRRAHLKAARRRRARGREERRRARGTQALDKQFFAKNVRGKIQREPSAVVRVTDKYGDDTLVTGEEMRKAAHGHYVNQFTSMLPTQPEPHPPSMDEAAKTTASTAREQPAWVDKLLPTTGLDHVDAGWWEGMMDAVTPPQVIELIFANKLQKAPGADGVTNALLRLLVANNRLWSDEDWDRLAAVCTSKDCDEPNSTSVRFLCGWMNAMLSADAQCTDQREGLICAIPKGEDQVVRSLSASRPLTMLNIPSKLLTALLAKRMSNVLERHPILVGAQIGFRRGKSCGQAIGPAQDVWEDAREFGRTAYGVSCDRAKAYDRLELWTIVRALKSIKVPTRVVDFVVSMYTGAQSRAITACGLTDRVNITRSCRQGCPWSPLIYIITEDSLHRGLSNPPTIPPEEAAAAARRRLHMARLNLTQEAESLAGRSITAMLGGKMKRADELMTKSEVKSAAAAALCQANFPARTAEAGETGYKLTTGSRPTVNSVGYADDVFTASPAHRHAQAALDFMSDWLYFQGQACSAAKSWCIAIKPDVASCLELCGEEVPYVGKREAVRYLGVWFRGDGCATGHSDAAVAKARRQAANVEVAGLRGWEASAAVKAAIVPGIVYGLAYMPVLDSAVTKLAATFLAPAKNAFGLPRSTANGIATGILGLPDLRDEVDRAMLMDCMERLGGNSIATRTARARLAALALRCQNAHPLSCPATAMEIPTKINRLAALARALRRNDLNLHVAPFSVGEVEAQCGLAKALGSHMLANPGHAEYMKNGEGHCTFDEQRRTCPVAALSTSRKKYAPANEMANLVGPEERGLALLRLSDIGGKLLLPWRACAQSLRSKNVNAQPRWHAELSTVLTAGGEPDGGALAAEHVNTNEPPDVTTLRRIAQHGLGPKHTSADLAASQTEFVLRDSGTKSSLWRVRPRLDKRRAARWRLEEWRPQAHGRECVWRPLKCTSNTRCPRPAVRRHD